MEKERLSLLGKIVAVLYVVAFMVITLMLLGQVLSAKFNIVYYFSDIRAIDTVNYQVNGRDMGELRLPATIDELQPQDEVTVTVTVEARQLNDLLVKTNNVKLRLYVNDAVYYTTGDPGTFPTFQKEPPVTVKAISLPRSPEVLELRFEYQLSEIAHSLTLPTYHEGDPALISGFVANQNVLSFALAIILLVVGLVLSVFGLTFYRRAAPAISLFWLGLSLVSCGFWTFCSNDLALYLFEQSTLFYNLSYIGLFIMPLPLIRFGIIMLRSFKSKLLEVSFWIFALLFIALMVCQLSGALCFGISVPIFHTFAPLMMTVYLAILLFARFARKTDISTMFIIANVILLLMAFAESLNALFGFVQSDGLLFQIGLLFDSAVVATLIWEFLIDAFAATEKNALLEVEMAATNRNLTMQRTLYENFTSSAEEIRKLRHDIRHQLLAVRGMMAEGKEDEAEQYIDSLYGNVPSIADKLICDNIAVNALAVHYLAQAEADDIQCDLRLDVPLVLGDVPDSDLSVIIGNLFENAIEACLHVDSQKRFIKMRSNVSKSRFTSTIDNSYDGKLNVHGQEFYSRKRNGKGIGIASIKAVVLKHNGAMKYEAQDGVFKTSLYIKI